MPVRMSMKTKGDEKYEKVKSVKRKNLKVQTIQEHQCKGLKTLRSSD
jgi:hypothetical protein